MFERLVENRWIFVNAPLLGVLYFTSNLWILWHRWKRKLLKYFIPPTKIMAPYLKIGNYVVGKKHIQAIPYWVPSAVSWGTVAFIGLIWIYDAEPIMKKVPFYRQKFRYPYEDDKRVYVEPVYDL